MSTASNIESRESESARASVVSDVSQVSYHSTPGSVSSAPHERNSDPNIGNNPNSTTIEKTTINRRNFYHTCNMKDASELGSRCDGEASLGRKGTFRANAIARRYNNNSRRHLLKQSQGLSVQSLLSNMTLSHSEHTTGVHSERTPLNYENSDIPEDERVTSFGSKSARSLEVYGSTASDSMVSNKEIKEKKEENIWINFILIWIGKPISIMFLFFPFALASHYLNWGPQWIFWLNFLVMVPLASILGDFTEEAALHTNDVVGGLLNASFGNAVEVVVSFNALMNDEIRVVQASLIGSIFSNLLLVLGCCFLFGGFRYTEQRFNSLNVTTGMGLLALSSIALILPTPFAEYYEIKNADVLIISRASACFLLFSYMQLLYFQLFTHRDLSECEANENDEEKEEDDIDEEEATVPMWMALIGLGVTTFLVTIFSSYLVDSIEGFCTESGISRTFVGLIILPIVGNAVEHITAVSVAMKNKMELAIGVCVGSCTQIALFVIPVTVIFGWCINKDMTLNYPSFEIQLYIVSIFTVSVCLSTGKSNWLLGSVLVITYCMVAIGFWFEKVESF